MPACDICGTERQWLHKHHLKPQHLGGTDADGLQHICANCHEDVHGGPCGGVTRGRTSASPEARAKKSATFKRLWKDPLFRRNVMEGRRKGKKRDIPAMIEKVKAAWTPERRTARSESMKEIRKFKNWSTKKKQQDLFS